MDEGIKRKLVGVAVLVVVALVVLPQVTPKTQNAEYLSKSVPQEEQVPSMEMPLPKSLSMPTRETRLVEEVEQEEVVIAASQIDTKAKERSSFEIPQADVSGQVKVWQIRVGSFAKPENAINLRDGLIKQGYKAFVKNSRDGSYVRVFVGPSSQKKSLENQLLEIRRLYKLEGEIVPYIGQ